MTYIKVLYSDLESTYSGYNENYFISALRGRSNGHKLSRLGWAGEVLGVF
jgi:hypothetical protein